MCHADCDGATPQPTLLKPGRMQQECLWLAVAVFFLPALGLQKDGVLLRTGPFFLPAAQRQ